jgi:outer membrane protein TolC
MLTPGANIVCSDVQLPTAVGTAQDFQWCRSGKDPNLDLQTARGYFSQLGSAGVRFQLEANAVFPITTFGKIWALRDVAKHGVALATLAREQVRAEITLMTHQAHATLLLAREAIRILAEARDVVRQARTRVDKDLGPEDEFDQLGGANPDRDPSDRYRVGLAEVALEERMREARRVESLSLSALWALAGTAAPRGFDVAEERLHRAQVSGGLAPVARYRELAATHRPEAKMAAAAVQLRRAEEKLARRNFLPDLGVTVGVAWARTPAADRDMSQLYYLDPWNYSRATAALALRWRFDIHNKTFDLRRARAEVRAADYQREAALLLLGRDVETAYEELRAAGHSLEQIARAVDLSWKLVVSQEQRDMVGGGNTKDLIRSLTDWYEWRFKQTEALMAHNVALARLSRAVGTALVAQPKSGAAAVHSQ